MTRKNKPRLHAPRNRLALPVIVFGLILVAAAAFLLTQQPRASGSPQIVVDKQSIDFGYVKLGETRAFKISVTNTGDGILRFKEKPYIEVLEGCCPPELTVGAMALAPGESTTVASPEFMMHAGMDGPHNFGVHLITNDPQQPDLMVNVLSDWGP